jgi:D-xylonolactonase
MMSTEPECIWAAGATLGEGPVWSEAEQALYWVDILERRLHRHTASGGRDTWRFDEEISSVAGRMAGNSLIVTLRHGFAYFDPLTGQLEYLAQPEAGMAANRFNDGKCDRAGRYWAGSVEFACQQPVGALYRLSPDLSCVRMDAGYIVTNGPAWSLDERTMYHTDSARGMIYAFDFDAADGNIANKRVFLQLGGADGAPDGMTTDADGCLWIAHWGAGKVTRRDPVDGKKLRTVSLPCSHVTSCAFGGPSFHTLYITTARSGLSEAQLQTEPLAGGLFALEPGINGLPANRFGN